MGHTTGEDLQGWQRAIGELRNHGYNGIEVDIHGLSESKDIPKLQAACSEVDMDICVLIFTSWPQYDGIRPAGLTVSQHIDEYRRQLQIAKKLGACMVNSHSAQDDWSLDWSVEFFRQTLQVDKEIGFVGLVCHETHRNRAFFSPWTTDQILQQVPDLRITADISHWVLVAERLLDGVEDTAILNRLSSKIDYIHARIGTTQSPQCPDPLHSAFAAERAFFESFWLKILDSCLQAGQSMRRLSFCPEYGPFPYQPLYSLKSNNEVADDEALRVADLFNKFMLSKSDPASVKLKSNTLAPILSGAASV